PGYLAVFTRPETTEPDRLRLLPAGTVVGVFVTLQAPNDDPGLDAIATGLRARMERAPSITSLVAASPPPVGTDSRAYTMEIATGPVFAAAATPPEPSVFLLSRQ